MHLYQYIDQDVLDFLLAVICGKRTSVEIRLLKAILKKYGCPSAIDQASITYLSHYMVIPNSDYKGVNILSYMFNPSSCVASSKISPRDSIRLVFSLPNDLNHRACIMDIHQTFFTG